jgi:hypothetical protein
MKRLYLEDGYNNPIEDAQEASRCSTVTESAAGIDRDERFVRSSCWMRRRRTGSDGKERTVDELCRE